MGRDSLQLVFVFLEAPDSTRRDQAMAFCLCTDQDLIYLSGPYRNKKGFISILEISGAISLIREERKSVTLANL